MKSLVYWIVGRNERKREKWNKELEIGKARSKNELKWSLMQSQLTISKYPQNRVDKNEKTNLKMLEYYITITRNRG